jgi:beta-lactamase regulating signal transducer with metallopeptidase domain
MSLALIGWTVLHSLWQWAIIAGLVRLALGLIAADRADKRHRVIGVGLALMVATAMATAIAAGIRVEPTVRMRVLYAFDGALMIPALSPIGATIMRTAAGIWIAGFAWQLLRATLAWRRVRTLRHDQVARDPDLSVIVDEVRRSLAMDTSVASGVSPAAHVPMVVGWYRPMLLLPVTASRRLTRQQLRMIVAHELAHVRRGDGRSNLLLIAADLVVFHHPAARWLSRQLRTEREYCCDDVAVRAGDVAGYARALATLEDARAFQPFAVAAASGTLLDRIERLAGQSRPAFTAGRSVGWCLGALVTSAVVFTVTANLPPPWLRPGVRLRRPPPRGVMLALPQPPAGAEPRLKVPR